MSQNAVLVSGAGGNLGSAVVRHYLNKGNKVAGFVHTPTNGENTHESLYKEYVVDLLNADKTAQGIEKVIHELGAIQTAVLTAGGFKAGDFESTSFDDITKMYRLNFETAYNLAHPLFMHIKQNGGGSLFFIGSLPGMNTKKGRSVVAYALSKSMLFQLANIINAEFDATGVRAFVVVPGTIDTPQNRKAVPDADFSTWEAPADIAGIIGRYTSLSDMSSINTEIVIREELEKY